MMGSDSVRTAEGKGVLSSIEGPAQRLLQAMLLYLDWAPSEARVQHTTMLQGADLGPLRQGLFGPISHGYDTCTLPKYLVSTR